MTSSGFARERKMIKANEFGHLYQNDERDTFSTL